MLQKGFTLIELMIVVAIIGILSMFALPAYQDYTKRTYVSEGMALATGAKMASTEYFSSEGTWPISNSEAGIAAATDIAGQAVSGIEVVNGTPAPASGASGPVPAQVTNIIIHYNQKVTGTSGPASYASGAGQGTVTIAPTALATAGSVEWKCTALNGSKDKESGTAGDILGKWLPANCRNEIKI